LRAAILHSVLVDEAMRAAQHLVDVGLGLDYQELRLERTTDAWLSAGAVLRDHVARVVGDRVGGVEHIGSSAIRDLLSKPIIDLAVGLAQDEGVAAVRQQLEGDDWIYRGDAGSEGGHVFVLEARPWHRVAHLHAVAHGGQQWTRYIRLRDVLRMNPEARRRYTAEKLRLVDESGNDRQAYTSGKSQVVLSLIRSESNSES
jgi:GrpB-like predicted nucleotidyltransferase (UPF0157 family)